MGQQIPISQSFTLPDGKEITIETGKLAAQADGSVVVRIGDTMLFCSVVSAKEAKPGQSFFPLSVDYQEKYASVGRIPGNFFRRETRLSDYEILISRLVDRAIRPLFPDGYMNETQVIINLISSDEKEQPDSYAALAASAALAVSDIPFAEPISEVRVARINGEYIVNPLREEMKGADLDIIVAATKDNVMMVEGEAKECQEQDLIDAIKVGHDAIKIQVEGINALAQKVGDKALNKREIEPLPESEDLKKEIIDLVGDRFYEIASNPTEKHERKDALKAVKESVIEALTEKHGEDFVEEHDEMISRYIDKHKKHVIREMVLAENKRLDGRKPEDIRHIWTEVDYLPAAHGSAIFTRGETQSLTSLTLGTKKDTMMVDSALDQYYDDFYLHYNFPAFSVGETKPMRGPSRREVGHANLAGRSLRQVLPKDNPYTIRIVSDILESNGSSSMATVCAGTLALMDAGIPIKAPVSGIAMGMISDGERYAILSDILGDEDALGDMDFKVTGTKEGITACQMDIKIEGLPYEVLEKALLQAKEGRLHILNKMAETLSEPRKEMKPHAPRIVEFTIDKSFIGAVIGPGGKIIQELQEVTGTVINIEEVDNKGIVSISSNNKESIDQAVAKIKAITFQPEVGDEFEAVVKTIMPYGVFVDFNGKSGLLHVSEISYTRIENVEDVFKEGDKVKVKIVEIDDRSGKIRLSRKVLLPKPEGWVERPPRQDRARGGNGRRGDRRGSGRDRRDRR